MYRLASYSVTYDFNPEFVIYLPKWRSTLSADNTVLSFVDSSVQHRGMRPNLIAMNNENSQKPQFKPGSSYLAIELKLETYMILESFSSPIFFPLQVWHH